MEEGVDANLNPSGALRAFQAAEKNDCVVNEIVDTIVIRAPIVKNVTKSIVHSTDEDVNATFLLVLVKIKQYIYDATMVAYTWLAKNTLERLASAGDMTSALQDAHNKIRMRFEDLSALQVISFLLLGHFIRNLHTLLSFLLVDDACLDTENHILCYCS